MTPEELVAVVMELRSSIAEKMVELEEEPNWGTSEEREELGVALDELIVQAQGLRDLLQEDQ
jgi:hypothetical protein